MIIRLISEIKRRGVISIVSSYAVLSWIAVQIVSVFSSGLAIPQWVVTLVSVLVIAGFPITIYVAWFFEFTAHGMKRTPNKDGQKLEPLLIRHWVGLLVISIVVSISSYMAYHNTMSTYAKTKDNVNQLVESRSIAVLPFIDLSAESDQAYLANGLSRELINLLGTFNHLKVSSSSSSFRLAELYADPVVIGQFLNVSTLLTGAIRSNGDQLRVSVELVDTSDAKVIWSKTISRKLVDIFIVEEEISRAIVNLIQDAYVQEGQVTSISKTASSDALLLYLRAQEQLTYRTTESIGQARKLFEQSLGLDPEYASAQMGLAKTLLLLADVDEGYGILDLEIATTLANRHLQKAIIRNPNLSEAQALFGRSYALNGEYELALSFYDKSISLNPSSAETYLWKYLALIKMQRYSDAAENLQDAYLLDPASQLVLFSVANEASRQRDLEEARTYFEKLTTFYPNSPLGYRGLADVAARSGNLLGAVNAWSLALEQSPDSEQYRTSLISILLQVGAVDLANKYIDTDDWQVNVLIAQGLYSEVFDTMTFSLKAYPNDKWILYEAGWYHFLYGDHAQAMTLMGRATTLFSKEELYNEPICMPAMEFAYFKRQNGLAEQAQSIIEQCQQLLLNARAADYQASDYDYLEARIAAFNNNLPEAIQALEVAYSKGWRERWSQFDPLFINISNEPRVKSIFEKINRNLDETRTLIEADGSL
jgi:TolB-like protein/Flp pilus assembly protein TadD